MQKENSFFFSISSENTFGYAIGVCNELRQALEAWQIKFHLKSNK